MGLYHRAVCLAAVQAEGIMRRQYARPDIRLGFGCLLPTRLTDFCHGFGRRNSRELSDRTHVLPSLFFVYAAGVDTQ